MSLMKAMAMWIWTLACAAALAGCVERSMVIRSEPPGAAVFVDGAPAGVTPCEVPFTFYGTRELILERDRHRSLKILVDLNPPAYQFFPLDFLTDVVLPVTIRDRHEFSYALEPSRLDPETEGIRERARRLKEKIDQPDR